jgi:hypothetical protein
VDVPQPAGFLHDHPLLVAGKAWDAAYRDANAPGPYEYGRKIFEARNPGALA